YVKRLKAEGKFDGRVKELEPYWQARQQQLLTEAESRLKAAQARLPQATPENKETAEKAVKSAQDDVARLKKLVESKDTKAAQKNREEKEIYLADAFKLITHPDLCLKCHQVGSIEAIEQQGPSLQLAWERLRPEWTQRWITNPQRFLHYDTIMPLNFPANAQNYQEAFLGKSFDQAKACRDSLMLYPMIADWAIFRRPAAEPSGGK